MTLEDIDHKIAELKGQILTLQAERTAIEVKQAMLAVPFLKGDLIYTRWGYHKWIILDFEVKRGVVWVVVRKAKADGTPSKAGNLHRFRMSECSYEKLS